MLTKEQCNEALDHFEKCYWNQDNSYGAMNGVRKDLDILNKLIHEHFDNPPLEFEELKPNMWVWDNEDKKYNKITEINGDKISFYYITSDVMRYICKFEPNRFYRKEVKDVD